MAGRFGRVRVPRQFASTKKMMDFRDFLFTEPKKPGEEIMLPDEKGGELKLTEVHMLEVEVDGVKIDGAFVSLKLGEKNVNTKLGRAKGTSIQKKRKGSGAVAAAVASKPKKNKSGGDGTVSGLLGRGKAKASKPGKEKPQGVGIGLLGRGKGRK